LVGGLAIHPSSHAVVRSTVGDSDRLELFGKVEGVNIVQQWTVLRKAAAGNGMASKRWDFLGRFVQLTQTLVVLFKEKAIPENECALMDSVRLADTWREFVDQSIRPSWADVEGGDFPADLRDCVLLTSWSADAVNHISSTWADDLRAAANSLDEALPSAVLISDPQLLQDKALQADLFANPLRAEMIFRVNVIGRKLGHLQACVHGGFKVPSDLRAAHGEAVAAKKRGKVAIGVDFCIFTLSSSPDMSDTAQMCVLANTCRERVDKLAIVIPAWLKSCLAMLTALPAPVPPSK
jgi:hypothetical protein